MVAQNSDNIMEIVVNMYNFSTYQDFKAFNTDIYSRKVNWIEYQKQE